MSLIKLLWRGELSLPMTYWAYGVGGVFLISFFMILTLTTVSSFGLLMGLLLFKALYMIFISVAIWRSADKYEGNRAGPFLPSLQ